MACDSEMNCNPITLISILRRYSREDYGAIFLYLPTPPREIDQEAWAWLQMLKSMGAARRRWLISADHAAATVGETHPHLFDPPPVCFETYRLDQGSLDRIFARL
ncbi:MAG: hypothetical protein AAGA21_12570 [Pseudomonadota bacterium]